MVYTKLIFSLSIFFIASLAGILPLYLNVNRLFFKKSEVFVCGIFLGAAIFHLLPNAIQLFHLSQYSHGLILGYGLMFISILLFWGLTYLGQFKWYSLKNSILPWLIFCILSFHSIISGLALGLVHQSNTLIILFVAIIAHKAFDSFALLIVLNKYNVTFKKVFGLIALFSLMTPLGIYIGSVTFHALNTTTANFMTACFSAFAAGSFIYIAISESLLQQWLRQQAKITFSELSLILFGFGSMALLAIWI